MDLSALERNISNLEASLGSLEFWLALMTGLVVLGLVLEYWHEIPEAIDDLKQSWSWKPLCIIAGAILITVGVAGELGIQFVASGKETELRKANDAVFAGLNTEAATARKEAGTATERASKVLTGVAQTYDCNSVPGPTFDVVPHSGFSSENPSIASLSPGPDADDETVNFVGAGTTKIWGNAYGSFREYHFEGSRCVSRFDDMPSAWVNVTSRPPDHIIVGDDNTVPRPECVGQGYVALRKIKFVVVDSLGRQMNGSGAPVQENFVQITPNTCPDGRLPKPQMCGLTYNGNFEDDIANNCSSHDSACGYSLNDEWQWCPGPSFPVNIGNLNDYVQGIQVTVNSNTTKMPNGTPIYP